MTSKRVAALVSIAVAGVLGLATAPLADADWAGCKNYIGTALRHNELREYRQVETAITRAQTECAGKPLDVTNALSAALLTNNMSVIHFGGDSDRRTKSHLEDARQALEDMAARRAERAKRSLRRLAR